MEFTKGMKLAVTKKQGGACKHNCGHEACQERTDIVIVKCTRKVKDGLKVNVISETYGYGYGILVDQYEKHGGNIEVIA
jgi:hypothetical protein